MRVCVLASGSRGNATYVEGGGVRLLIDAGLSCRALEKRLAEAGLAPDGLDAILVTHEHADHVAGLDRFARKHAVTVYANEGTAAVVERQCRLARREPPDFAVFESRVPFTLGGLTVTPVRVSHDTAEPVAYTLAEQTGHTLGYFTDLGFVSDEAAAALAACEALVLESNHDPRMLRASGRPYPLIARIAGQSGHLSNDQACEALATLRPPRLRRLVLAHLSQECNDPAVARAQMARTLRAIGRDDLAQTLAVAAQDTPTPPFDL